MKHISAVLLILLVSTVLGAQDIGEAGALRHSYQFDKALNIYEKLLNENPADSAALSGYALAENGKALTSYAAGLRILASKRVLRKDFFLYYSHLADKSWDTEGNIWPEDSQKRYFARRNAAGDYDIVYTEPVNDTLWSAPEPFCKEAVSSGNEIFPMVSPDGRRLYFSSDGLFGMGGYDLFVAAWDKTKKAWGNVQNMGFPFSSTSDDLLFCDTEDGRFSLFASNRDCGKDSVVIYVIGQETPVWTAVPREKVEQAARLGSGDSPDAYSFVRRSHGVRPDIVFEDSEEEFDFTFKIGSAGVLLEDATLPSGIVYQIQLFVLASRPAIKQLKGISPVLPHRQRSGKTLYAAGVFRSYAEAEQALLQVRKAGFPSAFIIAFEDGSSIALSKARQKESSVKVITEEFHIVK